MLMRKTEIGRLPSDWKVAKLEECLLTKPMYGVNAPACNFSPHLPKYIRITDIDDAGYFSSDAQCSVNIKNPEYYYLQNGDIVFARTGASVGKSYLYNSLDGKLVFAGFLIKISIDPNIASAQYIFSCVHTKRYWDWVQTTSMRSGQPGINGEEYASFLLPLPLPKEQEAIAEALSDADALIASLQKLIAKKKAIKQGAMQELLTGKRRLPGFSGKWKTYYLEQVIAPRKERVSPEASPHEKCIELEHVQPITGKILGTCKCGEQKSLKAVFYAGDILFGKLRPYLRKYATPEFSGVCSTEIWVFNSVSSAIALNKFAYYILQSDWFIAAANSTTGTKMPRADWAQLKNLDVKIPPSLDEQFAIAQVLSDMDTEITHLDKKLSKYQQIKQGMMQELITGRIRLVVNAEPKQEQPAPAKKHNQQFDDAVMIAGIVDAFYSETYPLGRKKVQKLLYLLRRNEAADVSAFQKKAAGPYADTVRYKGGEPIAIKSNYVSAQRSAKGTKFSRGANIEQALGYIQSWGKQSNIEWLISNFQRTRIDDLELFATVDMAICDLREMHKAISVQTIKELIHSTEEWREKLTKTYFSDLDIQRAINKCRELFGEH